MLVGKRTWQPPKGSVFNQLSLIFLCKLDAQAWSSIYHPVYNVAVCCQRPISTSRTRTSLQCLAQDLCTGSETQWTNHLQSQHAHNPAAGYWQIRIWFLLFNKKDVGYSFPCIISCWKVFSCLINYQKVLKHENRESNIRHTNYYL